MYAKFLNIDGFPWVPTSRPKIDFKFNECSKICRNSYKRIVLSEIFIKLFVFNKTLRKTLFCKETFQKHRFSTKCSKNAVFCKEMLTKRLFSTNLSNKKCKDIFNKTVFCTKLTIKEHCFS